MTTTAHLTPTEPRDPRAERLTLRDGRTCTFSPRERASFVGSYLIALRLAVHRHYFTARTKGDK